MFRTSVDELIQQDFRLSRTLHDELSSIRLIRTYFSNTFCHESYISDRGTVKNNLGTFYIQFVCLMLSLICNLKLF